MQPASSSKQFFRQVVPKIKTYFIITVLSSALFFALIKVNSYFQLKTIQIKGDVPNGKIIGLESLKGTSLILLSEDSLINLINKNTPNIVVEEVIKEYPDKLVLRLISVDSIVQLPLNVGFAKLAEDGKILKKTKEKEVGLPVINFYQRFDYSQLTPGSILNYKEIITSLSILKKSQELDLKVKSIDINGLNMIVFNLNGQKILLSAEKSREKQIFELETLITQFKIKAQDFKVLDLRFDKPTVKF